MIEKQMFGRTNVFSISKNRCISNPFNYAQNQLEVLSHCSPKDLPSSSPFRLPTWVFIHTAHRGVNPQPRRRYAFVVAPEQSHLAEVHTVSFITGECHWTPLKFTLRKTIQQFNIVKLWCLWEDSFLLGFGLWWTVSFRESNTPTLIWLKI